MCYTANFLRKAAPTKPVPKRTILAGSGAECGSPTTLSLPPFSKPRYRTTKFWTPCQSAGGDDNAAAEKNDSAVNASNPVPVKEKVNVAESPTPIPRAGEPPP